MTFDEVRSHMDEGIRQTNGTLGVVLAPDPQDGTRGWSVYNTINGGVEEWTDDPNQVRTLLARMGALDTEWEIGYDR